MNRIRVAGIIIKDNKILLMHRIKNGREYYVFPGGKAEKGETPEQTAIREIKEEVTLDVHSIGPEIFKQTNDEGNNEIYFLITDFSGEAKLSGEELERMSDENQYMPEWWDIEEAKTLESLYPGEVLESLL